MNAQAKLPELSVDLRKKTLEEFAGRQQVPIIIPDTDIRVAIVKDVDIAGAIVDRFNAYPKAILSLRALAIVDNGKGHGRRMVYDGKRCRLCGGAWPDRVEEKHSPDFKCILEGSSNATA